MAEFLTILSVVSISLIWIGVVVVLSLTDYWPLSLAILVAGLTVGIYFGSQQPPCAMYETRAQYDPSLKIVRQMRVCTERGEWIDG